MDGSDDESEDSGNLTPGANDESYAVSSAYLTRILKTRSKLLEPVVPTDDNLSRALVVFKPSPWSAKDTYDLDGMSEAQDMANSSPVATSEVSVTLADPDAMDIE
jgi:hypothetical protein